MDDRDKVLDYAKSIKLADDYSKGRKNFTQGYFYREIGHYNNAVPSEFQWAAEDKLINKTQYEELKCQLPDSPRSTFLMVFSPDGKKVASTHGNHNVYVTDLTTGKNIQTLSGHPRTPWCIAFHPSSNQILASGCLGGQVRVWDLQGRSEVWTAESQTVIASLAFHPVDRMLVIATCNELHFWDWSQPEPFAKCCTKSEREKVRYVSFDRLGNKLITGIANPVNIPSQWDRISVVNNQSSAVTPTTSTTSFSSTLSTTVATTQLASDQGRSITFCYRHLMNQYNQLVNRYLNLSRSRITPTVRTDRGTDPMDLIDVRNNGNAADNNPVPTTSNSQSGSLGNSSSSALRFKITGSNSRSLSNRRKLQLLSSLNNRMHGRNGSGSTNNSSVAFTTSGSTSNHNHFTIYTMPSTLSTRSASSSQSLSSRARRCALNLGPTPRSWCLTFAPDNSSNLFTARNTSQSNSSSGAVTNPTYTSYTDRGIFSTRESSSNHSGASQFSVVCPYRMLLNEMGDHRLTIHRAVLPNVNETSSASQGEVRASVNVARRTDFNNSIRALHTGISDAPRENQRSVDFNFSRHRNDLRNLRNPHGYHSQLRLITSRETHGLNLQNNQNLRRQLSFRPEGQFVLSRHSNSPFQPRIPHQVNVATTTDGGNQRANSGSTSRPEIPSLGSSFAASSTLNSAGSSSSSAGSTSFQPPSASDINAVAKGIDNLYRIRREIQDRIFDRVKKMLRDRGENSSEVTSVDSTVNYSQISGETDEVNESTGLGPRGVDPLLSSTSDNRDASNDGLFLQESPTSGCLNSASETANGQQNESEVVDLWESEAEQNQFSMNTNLPMNDFLEEQQQDSNQGPNDETSVEETEENTERLSSNNTLPDTSNMSANERNMREGIQRLSLQIEGMQVLCRARLEILQREKIRGAWDNLSGQIRQFQDVVAAKNITDNLLRNITSSNESSNASTELPSLRDLAISSSPLSDSNNPQPSTSSSPNHQSSVINAYRELIETMVSELFQEVNKSRNLNESVGPSRIANPDFEATQSTSRTNESEEPQPGPSGFSSNTSASTIPEILEKLKRTVGVKHFADAQKRDRRKRVSRFGGGNALRNLRRPNHYLGLRHLNRRRRIPDYFSSSSRTLKRRFDDRRGRLSPPASVSNNILQTSSFEFGNSGVGRQNACQSCGQKKKLTMENGGQKRRNSDSEVNRDSSASASKISKSNTGERSQVSVQDEVVPSTSSAGAESSSSQGQTQETSNELLNQMIQTMSTMLKFLREAFSRVGEQGTGQDPRNQASSGDDTDEERTQYNIQRDLLLGDLAVDFRRTKRMVADLVRDITQLRAKELLVFTVKCLTHFFGNNFGSLIQVLDEQFISLYRLLHLAMELTDLLLRQLNSRRASEIDSQESGDANSHVPRSIDSFTRSDQIQNADSSSYSSSFSNSQDSTRFSSSNNVFLPASSSLASSRLGSSRLSASSTYDKSRMYLSNYARRRRRRTARMSTSLPSIWASHREEGVPATHSSSGSISVGRDVSITENPASNLRSFRFDRRTNEEPNSHSDVRAFSFDSSSFDNVNSTNSNNDNNNNNNNDNNNNGNVGVENDDNNYSSNEYRNSNFDGDSLFNNSQNNGNHNNTNTSGSNNNNYFNNYYQSTDNSNADSGNNNIIIVTGLSSENDVTSSPGNNSSRSNSSDGSGSARASGLSYIGQNPLTPLRSMELTLSRNDGSDLSLRDERPIFWIRYGGGNESSGSSSGTDNQSRVNTFTVPVVQVNDVPISDVAMLNQPRHRPQSPVPRGPEDIWRWRAWRPRLLHPRNPFEDQDSNDVPENIHYYRILGTSAGSHLGVYTLDPIITDAPMSPRHRIQAWDFSQMNIPDISDREANGVVPECKIHNDASVDVSKDGHLLVTLLPAGRLSVTTMLGVYSLDWSSLGQLLYRTSFEQNAVSVSLSPTNRHLLVGLASHPVVVRDRTNMAQIFRLEGGRPSPNGGSWQSGRGRLVHMRDLEQTRETNMMSLNCIRWAPGAGQGLVYGTNTGQLRVLR